MFNRRDGKMKKNKEKKALQKIAIVFDRNGQIQLTTLVQETFRYLDSKYFHSSQLTKKIK